MIFKKNIPITQETSMTMSLGPFLVFDAVAVVVRRSEVVVRGRDSEEVAVMTYFRCRHRVIPKILNR